MEWVCNIALFLVFSGLLLELIADTKYYKFAQWVASTILLLQFIQPFTDIESIWNKFTTSFQTFDYAMKTDKVVEQLYQVGEQTETKVLQSYKMAISEQVEQLLQKHGLQLKQIELEVKSTGELVWLKVRAIYQEKEEVVEEIKIIEIEPIKLEETVKKEVVSPMELYIIDCLSEFYQIDKNKIEVVIQEVE